MATEFWTARLAVVVLAQTAAVATSVYLHRALAHRSLTLSHPVVPPPALVSRR